MSHGGDSGGSSHGGGGHGGGHHGGFGHSFGGGHGSHDHGGGHHHHHYDEPGGPGPFGYRSIWRIGFWRPRYYRSGVYIHPGGCLFALVFFSIVGIFLIAQYWWAIIAGTLLCIFALIAFLSRKPANTGDDDGGYYQASNQQGGNPYHQAPEQYPPNPGP
jgi:hypothetical protein